MILAISAEHKKKYFVEKQKGGVIYKITNVLNGDLYIGGTNNLIKRYYTHKSDIKRQKNTCTGLIKAANEYGEENFKFEIICECLFEELLKFEQEHINKHNPKYNIAKIAGSNLGIKRTDDVKTKKSILQKSKWQDKLYRDKHLESLSRNWKKGSNHKMAKLTEKQVIEIKKQFLIGLLPKQISDIMKLSYHSIKDIQRGKTWKHVEI